MDHLPSSAAQARTVGATRYFTGQPCLKGHVSPRYTKGSGCCACAEITRKSDPVAEAARVKRYQDANKDRYNAARRAKHVSNPEHLNAPARARYSADPRPQIQRALDRRSKQVHTGLFEMFKDEIRQIYNNCPKGKVVDHIMPLQGSNTRNGKAIMCGLHVPWNLQYLTPLENCRKSNLIPDKSEWLASTDIINPYRKL